jgi:glycosyltransferase involved in cell wall biosynthesis
MLMVIGLFHPVVGGAEKACQALSKRLMEKGISVTILTQYRDGLPEYEIIDGIPVFRKMKGWHPLGLAYMFSVLWFLIKNRGRFDIIQCFGLFLFIPPAVLMKYFFDKKVVLRLLCSGHCGDFSGIKQLTFKRLIVVAAKRCDRIICLSQDIKQELLEYHFSTKKLVWIPNGVDIERFTPLYSSEQKGSKNICFVGRIEAQKGLEFLIKAMGIVITQEKNVNLFIVGSGAQRIYLEDLCRSLKLDGHIAFVGGQDNVLFYYHQSEFVILPSESEGMSNVLLEAMACALPIVATDIGGNVELVGKRKKEMMNVNGGKYFICENGILVSPQDVDSLAEAIVHLLRNRTLSNSMGHSARKKVEESYSLNHVTSQYFALYESL